MIGFILITLILLILCCTIFFHLYKIWKDKGYSIFTKITITFLEGILLIVLLSCEVYTAQDIIYNDFKVVKIETIENPYIEEKEYMIFVECNGNAYLLYVPEAVINEFKENKIVVATFNELENKGIEIVWQN